METTRIENIKTFQDALGYLGKTESETPDFSTIADKKTAQAMLAHYQLLIIAQAINQIENNGKVWTPNWNDWSENKYYPWFAALLRGSAFRFAATMTGTRIRVAARAFATKAAKRPNMRGSSLRTCTSTIL